MAQISGVIITFNEERNIARCIDSISKVVDEIVVVDSFSTDRTKEICLEKGVKFIENKFEGYIEQKNFAIQLCNYAVVLSLDADEYLSDELINSILEIKKNGLNGAYKMNRLSFYGDKAINHGSWYPDKQLRLWGKDCGKWGGAVPHENVVLIEGIDIHFLKGDILHRSYKDASDVLSKIQIYSSMFSKNNNKKKISVLGILSHTTAAFLKSYILKLGFLNGYEGLAVAMCIANHTFYKYSKLFEGSK